MKNILLLVPSLYRENAPEQVFQLMYTPKKTVAVKHTNMPVFCSISELLSKSGEQIDGVLLLCSKEVLDNVYRTELGEMTTYEYLREKFLAYRGKKKGTPCKFIKLGIPSGELVSTNAIQSRVDEALAELNADSSTRIWVDFTSGLRTYAILLVFIIRFLEMRNCGQVADILYANLKGSEINCVESCLGVYRLFDHYQLLDRVSETPRSELAAYRKPNEWQLEINAAFDELIGIHNLLRSQLLNTSGNTKELIVTAKVKAQIYAEKYASVPIIRELSNRILHTFSEEDDMLSFAEYLVKNGQPSLATLKLRDNAFRYLIENSVIKTEHSAVEIETEILSAYKYYQSFIRYMADFIHALLKDLSIKPSTLYAEKADVVLRDRYNKDLHNEYSADDIAEMREAVQGHFEDECSSVMSQLRLGFAQKVYEISGRPRAPHGTIEAYEKIRREYQQKEKRYHHIYQMSGFPLPCFDLRGAYYYRSYQKDLLAAARELVKLLECKQQRKSIADTYSYVNFAGYDLSVYDYYETINICLEHLEKMVPLRFSYQSGRGCEQEWDSNLRDEKALQEFLIDYLPVHAKIRSLRNDFAHPDETEVLVADIEEMMPEKKAAIVLEGIRMLREVAAKERK